MKDAIRFFAASNTARGFVSLFDRLYEVGDGKEVFLIQGGPGTGKSTLMRRIARRLEENDRPFEYLHCSSDPDSLDGVLCEADGRLILDATPPHTVAPRAVGVIERTVDLSGCWDREKLTGNAERIFTLGAQIRSGYEDVYRLLAAAGRFKARLNDIGLIALNEKKYAAGLRRLLRTLIPKRSAETPGRVLPRYLSGVTPKGVVFFEETVHALADRVYVFRDDVGTAARRLLAALKTAVTQAGYDCYCCYDPLIPDACEHLIVPELRLAFVTGNSFHAADGKTVDLRRYYDAVLLDANRAQAENCRRKIRVAVDAAGKILRTVKTLHDELEAIYIAAMDFHAVDALAEQTVTQFTK